MNSQLLIALIFFAFLLLFLYSKRKNIEVQKIIFPLLYIILVKTKWGLLWMDKTAKRWNKQLKILGYIGIGVGYLGMLLISFALLKNIYDIFVIKEALPGVGLVLPIQAKGVFYVPFVYWIISIFLLATVHEFAHGVIARVWDIKVQSSGVGVLCAFVPLIPVAFVEPDEKQLLKKPKKAQLSMFAAGPFANIIFAFLIIGFVFFIFNPMAESVSYNQGVEIFNLTYTDDIQYGAELAGMKINEIIVSIDSIDTPTLEDFRDVLAEKAPGDVINVKTNVSAYEVTLSQSPDDPEKALMGVQVNQVSDFTDEAKDKYGFWLDVFVWVFGLLYWLQLLNLGIGLFNLLPIAITDGGRMFLLATGRFVKDEKTVMKIFSGVSWFFGLAVLFLITMAFF